MTKPVGAQGLHGGRTSGNSQGTGEPSAAQSGDAALARRDWPPPLPRRLAPFVADYVDFALGLASDKGGLDGLSTVRRGQIELASEIRALRRKCGRNLFARGLVRRNGELRDAVHTYVALANAEARTLRDLGAEREARAVETLSGYLAAREERGRGDANGDGNVSSVKGDGDRPAEANVEREP